MSHLGHYRLNNTQLKALRLMVLDPSINFTFTPNRQVLLGSEIKTSMKIVHTLLSWGLIRDISDGISKTERFEITKAGIISSQTGYAEGLPLNVYTVRKALRNQLDVLMERQGVVVGNRVMTMVERAKQRLSDEDKERIDAGKWYRAGGDCICTDCQKEYGTHPMVPGASWLNRLCNGDLIKT